MRGKTHDHFMAFYFFDFLARRESKQDDLAGKARRPTNQLARCVVE